MIKILERLKTISGNKVAELVKPYTSPVYVDGVLLDTRLFNIDEYKNLKVISRIGVGVNNLNLNECKKRDIEVCITPCKELTDAVAEFTLSLMLRLIRSDTKGRNLSSMIVGVIGYGRIGKRLVEMLEPITHRILYCDINNKETWFGFDNYEEAKEQLLSVSDIVSINVSGNNLIIGKEELKRMPRGFYLVNTARAECVDERAVARAVRDSRLAGFASDVNEDFVLNSVKENCYFDMNNVIFTPHIASNTVEARTAMERMAVDNLIKGLKKGVKK